MRGRHTEKEIAMSSNYLIVPVHDFKTNFSKYLKLLEKREKHGIVVRRYKKKIAMLVWLERPKEP